MTIFYLAALLIDVALIVLIMMIYDLKKQFREFMFKTKIEHYDEIKLQIELLRPHYEKELEKEKAH
jgi:uncharacterized protein YoxC